jgi:hypothetical protein
MNELIFAAWHAEAFARTKKLKPLKRYLIDESKHDKKQTPEQLLVMGKAMAIAFGGETKYVKSDGTVVDPKYIKKDGAAGGAKK